MAEIKVNDDSVVIIPKRSGLFGVERKNWERIKKLVKNLSLKSSRWENAAWFSLAEAIAFFTCYFSVDSTNLYRDIFMTSGIFLVVITVIFFIVSYSFSVNTKKEQQCILDEMSDMEISEENNTQQMRGLEIFEAYYGSSDRQNDIKETIKKMVTNDSLSVKVDNSLLGGDPCPGISKILKIKFSFNGVENTKFTNEGDIVKLP